MNRSPNIKLVRWVVGLALWKNANKCLIARNVDTNGEEGDDGKDSSHLIPWRQAGGVDSEGGGRVSLWKPCTTSPGEERTEEEGSKVQQATLRSFGPLAEAGTPHRPFAYACACACAWHPRGPLNGGMCKVVGESQA